MLSKMQFKYKYKFVPAQISIELKNEDIRLHLIFSCLYKTQNNITKIYTY